MGSEIITAEFAHGFEAAGIRFKELKSNWFENKTTENEVVILKGPQFLRSYDDIFRSAPAKNVLEFGVFEGGSILYFALAYPEFRFVGVDIRDPDEAVLSHIRRLGLTDRVKIYYNTSQSDQDAMNRIIVDDFKSDDLGIVIDDASHNYRLSKKTFEFTFGRVGHRGTYCLEDWAWAHWGEPYQTKQWVDQPALTNLVFEILMLYPSTQDLIEDIRILPAVVQIRRGTRKVDMISTEKMLRARGKTLTSHLVLIQSLISALNSCLRTILVSLSLWGRPSSACKEDMMSDIAPEAFHFEHRGYCEICERQTTFLANEPYFRSSLRCTLCRDIPRKRALFHVLRKFYPNWQELAIHESSPGTYCRLSARFRKECRNYVPTQWDLNTPFGHTHPTGSYRSEDLQSQTFGDSIFDLVITQDVFEHIFRPDLAIKEIARTLKVGGAFLCTVPIIRRIWPSRRRASFVDGQVVHELEPNYHTNPVSMEGALVTVDWGYDIVSYLQHHSGLSFMMLSIDNIDLGIRADLNEVLVGIKRPIPSF